MNVIIRQAYTHDSFNQFILIKQFILLEIARGFIGLLDVCKVYQRDTCYVKVCVFECLYYTKAIVKYTNGSHSLMLRMLRVCVSVCVCVLQ